MANNGEFIELASGETLKQIKEIVSLINQGADGVVRLNSEFAKVKTPSGNKSVLSGINQELANSEKIRLSEIKLQQDREKAFDKYSAQLAKKEVLEARTTAKQIAESEKIIRQKEKEFAQFEREFNKYEADLKRKELAEARYNQKKQIENQKAEKALAKEALALERSQNAYNRIQSVINRTTQEYNNLAVRKEINGSLSEREENRLNSLTNRISRFQGVLGKVDANIGKYQRNVYNYASGWNGLSNSINQLTREAPAFAVSLNTGFLALSNNIPMLFDEIERTKNSIARLKAEGKAVPSLFSQIASSVLSFQTLISVGVTLLTLYGGALFTWIGSLNQADDALGRITESQLRYNDASTEGEKNANKKYEELGRLSVAYKNEKLSIEQRNIAYDKLIKMYPAYFKEADRQKSLNNEFVRSQFYLMEALNKRAQAEAKLNANSQTQDRIIDIESEIKAREEYTKALQHEYRDISALNKLKTSTSTVEVRQEIQATIEKIEANEKLRIQRRDINDEEKNLAKGTIALQTELDQLNKEDRKARREINKLYGESLLLDKEDKKVKTSKVKMQKDEIDYLAKVYELRKLNSEVISNNDRRVMDDEERNFKDRSEAVENYYFQLQNQANLSYDEEIRLSNLKLKEETKRYNYAISQGTGSLQYLEQLNYQFELEKTIIRTRFEDKSNQLTIDKTKALQNVLLSITTQSQKNALSEKSIEDLRQVGLYMKNISGATTINQFSQLDNKLREIANNDEDRKNEAIRLDLIANRANQERIKSQLSTSKDVVKDNEAINKLKAQELELTGQLIKSDNSRAEAIKSVYESMANSTNEYLNSIGQNFLSNNGFGSLGKFFDTVTYQVVNDLGEIETRTGSTFQKMWDQAKTGAQRFAIAFTAITDVVKESMDFINQNQQAYFDAQYDSLKKEKDLALEYAGDSATGKAEIERQYEERRSEIDRRKAKAQKDTAIFNAIINTAQAVTAFLAEANYAGAILAGVLGAAQIGIISNSRVPEYALGTDNHAGGLAIVGDGGKNEVVYQPSKGFSITPKNDTLVDLEKGSKVYPDFNSFLKNSGAMLGGIPNIELESSGASASEIDSIMGKYFSNITTSQTTIDKNGFNSYIAKKNNKMKMLNNRVSGKGFSV